MQPAVQLLMNSIISGSTYALVALGYALVYSILRFLNWTHGYIVMLGGFFAYSLIVTLKFNAIAAFFSSIALCALVGYAVERVGYRPLRKARRLAPTLTGIGMAQFLEALALLVWGADIRTYPRVVEEGIYILGARITVVQIVIIGTAGALLIGLRWLIYRSLLGLKIRAAADDMEMLSMLGTDANYVISSVFMLGGGLAAAAGILVGWDVALQTTIGLGVTMKAFAAVILGGFGSIDGAIIGGLIIGFAENFGVWFLPAAWKDSIAFIILVLVLLVRPSGIAGVVSETEV